MPRKPTSLQKGLSKAPPLGFSSFARSAARVATSSMQRNLSKLDRKVVSKTRGKEFVKQTLKERIENSESSSKEEDDLKAEHSESSSEAEDDLEAEHSESSSEAEDEVQADFAFFDPKPDDFHGVKMLLQAYLDDKQWDMSGFVDLILGQTTVGSVVKIEDVEDDAPFSVVTALNLGRYKDHKCIMDIKGFLSNVCPENDVKGSLRMLLEEQVYNVGLLVSQRVVNLPLQLLPPLYDALFDEVSWATEDEPTEELRQSFRFKFYILATKVYKHKSTSHQKGKAKKCTDEPIIYVKDEDEIFHKLSSWSFNFPLHTQQPAAQELKNYKLTGLVMAVEADKVPIFRKELHSLINGS